MTEKNIEKILKDTLSQEKDVSKEVKDELFRKMEGENMKNNGISFTKIIRNTAAVAACFLLSIAVMANADVTTSDFVNNIPIVKNIAKVVTFRTYEDDNGKGVSAYFEKPKVEGLESMKKAEDELNKKIDEYYDSLIKLYESEKEVSDEEGHFNMTTGYNVMADNDEYFSIRVWTNIVMGGSTEYHKTFTVNKGMEKVVDFSDFFATQQERDALKDVILAKMDEITSKNEDLVYWKENVVIDDNTKFYINENGEFVVYFNKYEVAPGFMGVQSFAVGKADKNGNVTLDDKKSDSFTKVTGKVVEATMNFVTIQDENGTLYDFSTEDATIITHGEGLLLDSIVDIYYDASLENLVAFEIEIY